MGYAAVRSQVTTAFAAVAIGETGMEIMTSLQSPVTISPLRLDREAETYRAALSDSGHPFVDARSLVAIKTSICLARHIPVVFCWF